MNDGNLRNSSNTFYPKHTHTHTHREKTPKQVSLTITSLPAADCQAGIWSHVSWLLTEKHTSSEVIFTSYTFRMLQPADFATAISCVVKKSDSVLLYVNHLNKCVVACPCAERTEAANNLALREIKASKWALLTLQHCPIWSWRR